MRSKMLWIVAGIALLAFWLGTRWPGATVGTQPAELPPAAQRDDAPEINRDSRELKWPQSTTDVRPSNGGVSNYPDFLPREAHDTLRLIERGGPFPHRQDGNTFQNRERRLPQQPRGYYREYTVDTPGSRDRGARRIVTGGRPVTEFYYTDDHYRSFRRFTLDADAHMEAAR